MTYFPGMRHGCVILWENASCLGHVAAPNADGGVRNGVKTQQKIPNCIKVYETV